MVRTTAQLHHTAAKLPTASISVGLLFRRHIADVDGLLQVAFEDHHEPFLQCCTAGGHGFEPFVSTCGGSKSLITKVANRIQASEQKGA
jgi:hypothetical protein